MRSIYCPKCDEIVTTEVNEVLSPLKVKNVDVQAYQKKAVCPKCKDAIADEEITKWNMDSAFDAYRSAQDLLTPQEIRETYSKYGLTQKSFATLLGLGGATLSRYENGALQSNAVNTMIRQAAEPQNMLDLLDEHANELPSDQVNAAKQQAYCLLTSEDHGSSGEEGYFGNLRITLSGSEPSQHNGFRRLDWNRVKHMAIFLAANCADLGRMKLNKGLFYADYSCFASNSRSMSGLMYAHATFGPIADHYDAIFSELVFDGCLTEELMPFGYYDSTVYKPAKAFDTSLFSDQEILILDKVAKFIDGFTTAKELSEYSHKEKLWIDTENGEALSYLDAFKLNDLERFIGV